MPKLQTQSRSLSLTGRQEPPEPEEYVNFKIGDRVGIRSNHPIFPGVICTVCALPSLDAAIVELESGVRERLLGKHLEPIEQEHENTCVKARIEIIEELSADEEKERHRLELKVERTFYECGCALRDLRDKRLYRSTHQTFEEYCQDRFGFARRHPYRLIDAVAVVDNLCPNGTQNQDELRMCPNGTQILPTSERQVRDLIKLQPEEQRAAWQQALLLADGKVPTSKIVKGVVSRMKEKPLYKASDFCYVGDVFTLTRLEGSERKYNGYPCVAIELKHFTINVDVYDTTLAVKPENLKKIDSPDVCRQLPVTLQRIRQLRNLEQVDRGEEAVLAHLGRQMYLTDFEEKLLSFLEQEHGIKPNS